MSFDITENGRLTRPIAGQREVVLIFGQTGSGKTYMARAIFEQCSRALVAEAGFSEFPAMHFDAYPDLVLYLEQIGAFENPRVPFRVSYSPLICEHGDIMDLSRSLGNMWLFLEEADRFEDPRNFPEYDEVVTRGRHFGVNLCLLGLHPYKLPKDLRRQATRIISFRQTERSDIEWLAEHVGESAYQLQNFSGPPLKPPHPFLYWTQSDGARVILPQNSPIIPPSEAPET